jgi:hypothetical protein
VDDQQQPGPPVLLVDDTSAAATDWRLAGTGRRDVPASMVAMWPKQELASGVWVV